MGGRVAIALDEILATLTTPTAVNLTSDDFVSV